MNIDTLATVLAQAGPMGPMGGSWHGPMSHGSWGAMGATWWGPFALLLTVLVVVAAALLWTRMGGDLARGDDALAELRRAYARGDLTDEEYERRRTRLS